MIFKARKFINSPYTIKEIFFILSISIIVIALVVVAIQIRTSIVRESRAVSGCDESYPTGFFRACYFEGIDLSGNFLGSIDEEAISNPVPETYLAVEHLWDNGVIFSGRADNISGVWRGRLNFPQGRYQFTVQTDDGTRLYINEQLIIDEWRDQSKSYAVGVDLNGYTNIRVEWYEATSNAKLRLHWDKGPTPPSEVISLIKIDFYIVPELNTCFVGNSYTSGDAYNVYNADHTIFKSFQLDSTLRTLKPSDSRVDDGTYAQSACLSFKMSPDDQLRVKQEVEKAFEIVKNRHTLGLVDANVRTVTLGPVEAELSRWGNGFWFASWNLQPLVTEYLTRETDFVLATHGFNEYSGGSYGKYVGPPYCGGTFGADWGVGGAGYSWVPQTQPGVWFECSNRGVYLNEWLHQLVWAMPNLMGLDDIYDGNYPACGTHDPDTYKWFPSHYSLLSDPDSPWCGDPWNGHPGADVGSAHLFLSHFDFSMEHYTYPSLYGNHCRNGIKDFSETGVDSGGRCPDDTQDPTVSITSPSEGSTVSGTVNVAATATDNVGVTKVGFYVGGDLKSTDTISPYSYSWDTTTVSNGSYSLLAKAYDAANNNATETINVIVSNKTGTPSPPTADIKANNSNGPISIKYNTSTAISWTSTNATSCSVSPTSWSGTSGSKSTGKLTSKKTYTLSCSGDSGSAVDSVTVKVGSKPATTKLADLNKDGLINIRDLSILLSRWRTPYKTADINGDGRVDIRDLSILLSRWGR